MVDVLGVTPKRTVVVLAKVVLGARVEAEAAELGR